MVAYAMHGSSSILAKPMRNRSAGSMLDAHETIVAQLPEGEAQQKIHILANECSKEFSS